MSRPRWITRYAVVAQRVHTDDVLNVLVELDPDREDEPEGIFLATETTGGKTGESNSDVDKGSLAAGVLTEATALGACFHIVSHRYLRPSSVSS